MATDNTSNTATSVSVPTVGVPVTQAISFNPSDYVIPNLPDYVKQSFDVLAPYYQRLLDEAYGDTNRAITRLTQDYQNNTRYTAQDLALNTGYALQDFKSALQNLGIQMPQEQENTQATLNQRGMAVTDQGSAQGGATNTGYATAGRGGYEKGLLSEDQALRQQAIARTRDRNLTQYGITAQRANTANTLTYQRGVEDSTRQLQQYGEQLQQQREQEAYQMGGYQQQQANTSQQLNLLAKQTGSTTGAYGGTGSSTATQPNYKPDTVNQTVQYGGATWQGQPGGSWTQIS